MALCGFSEKKPHIYIWPNIWSRRFMITFLGRHFWSRSSASLPASTNQSDAMSFITNANRVMLKAINKVN